MAARLKASPAGGGSPTSGRASSEGDEPSSGPASSGLASSGHPSRDRPEAENGDGRFDSPELQQLRDLLLSDDRHTIEELRAHLARLSNRVGDDKALGDALEGVLVDTLRRMQSSQAQGLRQALAPVVVKTIRSEVRNSREELVNALYPLTGKMVAAAMRDAVRKLSDNINESVERASNPALIFARVRARLGGKPVAAKLLERRNTVRLNRAILINRVSGTVECSFSEDDAVDDDLVGGLISALSTFATQTYARSNSELRTIELDGRQLLLRHSPLFLLALEVDGEPSDGQAEAVDALFLELMTQQDANPEQIDEARLEQFVRDVEAWRPPRKRTVLRPLLAVAVLAGTVWFAVQYWQAWTFERQVERVRTLVTSQDALHTFGVQVSGDRAGDLITVRGLVPVGFAMDAFEAQARGLVDAPTALNVALQPIETAGRLGEHQAETGAVLAAMGATQRGIGERLDTLSTRLDGLYAGLTGLETSALQAQDELQSAFEGLKGNVRLQVSALSTTVAAGFDRLERTDATTGTALASLEAALGRARAALAERLGVMEATGADMSRLADANRLALEKLETAQADLAARFEAGIDGLARSVRRSEQALAALEAARRMRLAAAIERSSLRFGRDADYGDPANARLALRGLADKIAALGQRVEIQGHTDRLGTQQENLLRGRERADRVRRDLLALGVPGQLLRVRSMGATHAKHKPGPGSADRHVSFVVEKP